LGAHRTRWRQGKIGTLRNYPNFFGLATSIAPKNPLVLTLGVSAQKPIAFCLGSSRVWGAKDVVK
jgi:hypothetical protein